MKFGNSIVSAAVAAAIAVTSFASVADARDFRRNGPDRGFEHRHRDFDGPRYGGYHRHRHGGRDVAVGAAFATILGLAIAAEATRDHRRDYDRYDRY